MKVGDYYVMTRQLRANGTMEFLARPERSTPDLEQAMREARGNAQRLRGNARGYGVEVHEVLAVDEGGAGKEFVCVHSIDVPSRLAPPD